MYLKNPQNDGIFMKSCYEKKGNILARKITRHNFELFYYTRCDSMSCNKKKSNTLTKIVE